MDPTRRRPVPADLRGEALLAPVLRQGRCVVEAPPLAAVREHAQQQLGMFHAGIKRFMHPHQYPVGLEQGLQETKTRLVLQARGRA